jgi:segregation and condensation protein B
MKEGILEGLLFVTGEDGLSLEDIEKLLELEEKDALELINSLKESLSKENRGLQLIYLGNKYKLSTKEEHKEYYELLANKTTSSVLSQSALETLAIISYNQPISVGQIDDIRGVDSTYQIKKLLYRNLIKEAGKSDLPGRPELYSVTDEFLDYLGLSSLDELPKLEEEKPVLIEETDLYESKYIEIY